MKEVFRLLVFVLTALLIAGCGRQPGYEKIDDGVIVHVKAGKGTKSVRLQVITDDIIRVTASPSETFSTRSSLMVVRRLKGKGDWKLAADSDKITLTTRSLRAIVSSESGAVKFIDSTGRPLLQELPGGGKYFTPSPGEADAFAIRQVFESPEDEAFYGLGGHQNGQMNYKGEDVDLVQHNIVAVVPFLYSSRNYGILWDNYSASKFGDPREYAPLSTLKLSSKDGKPKGLTATYYAGDRIVKTSIEDRIDFEFLETPQVDSFPKDVAQSGKVIWEGTMSSPVTGAHKFWFTLPVISKYGLTER
jgi:alpha-D-xyloside xylohydrolase